MELSKANLELLKQYFASQKDILVVYLYGSFASGGIHKRSDIDFGVLFEEEVTSFKRLGQIYSDLCGLKLPAEPEVRDIDLKHPPVYLFNVIRGQLVYSKDEVKRINFEVQAMSQYYDSQYFRDIKYDYMRKRIQEGTYGY
ncbi:nucleotidyltransferase domain-containing protein [Candidatus Daviesbacteria bacterium]|nr:nucleotidyltransferase domain-containing protein [Candidatus Daviesbacteria bacterium]